MFFYRCAPIGGMASELRCMSMLRMSFKNRTLLPILLQSWAKTNSPDTACHGHQLKNHRYCATAKFAPTLNYL